MPWPLYLFTIAVLATFVLVHVSSIYIENPPGDRDFADWMPWMWEVTSAIGSLCLIPLLYLGRVRLTPLATTPLRLVALHAAGIVLFSLGHVAIMVGLRKLGCLPFGMHYDFSHGNLPLELIYEGRKDALSYAIMLGIFWGYGHMQARPQPPLPARIEVRSDGRTLFLEPGAVTHVEAAGNYVELHRAGDRPLLLRGTLGDFEARLVPYGFVRIHRSRLVQRARIASFESTSSGDLRVVLDSGQELAGSRRFRDKLK